MFRMAMRGNLAGARGVAGALRVSRVAKPAAGMGRLRDDVRRVETELSIMRCR